MLSSFSPSPAVAPLSTVPHHSALPATDQMTSLAQPKLLWSSSRQESLTHHRHTLGTGPIQVPTWSAAPGHPPPHHDSGAVSLQPRLAPPRFRSSTHGKRTSAASTLIRTGGARQLVWDHLYDAF